MTTARPALPDRSGIGTYREGERIETLVEGNPYRCGGTPTGGTPQASGTSQAPNGTPMYRGNPHVSKQPVKNIRAPGLLPIASPVPQKLVRGA